MGILNKNHYICEVTETCNGGMIMSRYFDGTQAEAVEYFLTQDCITKYVGRENHEVYMRSNSVDLSTYKFDVWVEGWRGHACISTAQFLGTFYAKDFYSACELAIIKDNKVKKWLTLVEGVPVYYGTKLFDNETEARKAHG